ncbi:prefoldin beta-like domain containing protein [Heterostelium album PN500]|uniref:Prefoldin beta-like domain containing protein n=1 Tax=Heterostelium pallidum (strain ATCC 26659 / Pp 5 / PN500) TaxID=670386 RepID=D3AVT9_HETP5|nr:prefoldin beta-like domain containing protein [Heterostelium album PN500]EFA86412.1 prefoldin beta-like domain containing protein [Heterostelium album PN500]|eukprot:XP_020438517.1 prefoldin beta-like domain containing protein [Heterostelium album PN500]
MKKDPSPDWWQMKKGNPIINRINHSILNTTDQCRFCRIFLFFIIPSSFQFLLKDGNMNHFSNMKRKSKYQITEKSTIGSNQVDSSIKYFKVVKNGISFYGRFYDVSVSDGHPTYSFVESIIGNQSNTNNISIGINLSQCQKCLIDPDFSNTSSTTSPSILATDPTTNHCNDDPRLTLCNRTDNINMSQQQQKLTNEQIVANYKEMKAQQSAIMNKLSEIESDASEHNLVLSEIEKLEPSRKCFRMVGGVLVERTVGDVLPVVKQNRDAIKELTKKLEEQLQAKTKELNEYAAKYNIRFQPSQS